MRERRAEKRGERGAERGGDETAERGYWRGERDEAEY